jgi:hypothetical protein
MTETQLKRFWIEFGSTTDTPLVLRPGCGVTAYSIEDALRLVSDALGIPELPAVVSVVENVDVSTLDANHILPNIGLTVCRGVWYPALNL